MPRILIFAIGALWAFSGLTIFFLPMTFYTLVPGVSDWGPFNLHFIRDVALAFVACGSIAVYGAWKSNTSLVLASTTWPTLHAGMHLEMWLHRGMPLDFKAASDGVLIVAPALAMLYFSNRMCVEKRSKEKTK
jgi:hypothetical protein